MALPRSVGPAQEDVDFHTGTLGLRFIKRTVLFDGSEPIYHLYYSNANGDPSSVVTTFPFEQAGLFGRRGTNQAREVMLAAPRGIEYVLVGVEGDPREGFGGGGVPREHGIHGIYGVGVHVYSPENQVEFASDRFFGHSLTEEGDRVKVRVGEVEHGNHLEIQVNRGEDPGTWYFGAGTIHHFAWNADSLENQDEVKFDIEGAGYTDISELKDRKYFKSVYVRTPSGALFELAVTHAEGGWTCDESPQELGTRFQLPEQFENRREEIISRLEPIEG